MPRVAIRLNDSDIPVPTAAMAVLRTADPVIPSPDTLNRLLDRSAQQARFERQPRSEVLAAFDGRRLVGLVDPGTNETQIFPKLTGLRANRDLRQVGADAAKEWLLDEEFFPNDDTRVEMTAPCVLMGAHRTPKRYVRRPAGYLSYLTFNRYVEDVQVVGPGTRAMVAVAGDGSVRALTHRWKPARMSGDRVEPFEATRIVDAIQSQLKPFATKSGCVVDDVTLIYYDGGGSVLQPAYRFTAVIAAPESDVHVSNQRLVGYLSIGNEVEPIPRLSEHGGEPPSTAARSRRTPRSAEVSPGDPTVGRYVVRQDNAGWVASANAFMSSLNIAQSFFFGSLTFTSQQYYWAEPRLFTSEKNAFVNSVQVALTEVHGNWGLFTTLKNNQDFVHLSDIPSSGYGGGGGGPLAYWIIHSCEVIPTATDENTSFDIWWTVFNGMHAVLGYRTEMYINDEVTGGFGLAVGLGAAVVPAWLQRISSDDSYTSRPVYFDDNRQMTEPLGRASAVNVYGHSDDTLHQLNNLGRPSTLTEWWFDN